MAEPMNTGRALQELRAVLYDLARRPGAHADGATQPEIINEFIARKWSAPIRSFDRLMARLLEVGAAEATTPFGAGSMITTTRYALTPKGDLEEELKRMSWLERFGSRLKDPDRVVTFLSGLVLGAFGVVLAAWLRSLGPP